ncbi:MULTISPECIES: hypothetical protein [unclassified Streptomyces]
MRSYVAVIGTLATEGSVAPASDSAPGAPTRAPADGLLLTGFGCADKA